MDTVKFLSGLLDKKFDSLSPFPQSVVAFFLALISHFDVVASVLAVIVLLFQLKASFYKSKREKSAFDRECRGPKK